MSQVSNDNICKGVENKRTCNCSQAWNVLGHSLSWAHLNRWIPNGQCIGCKGNEKGLSLRDESNQAEFIGQWRKLLTIGGIAVP